MPSCSNRRALWCWCDVGPCWCVLPRAERCFTRPRSLLSGRPDGCDWVARGALLLHGTNSTAWYTACRVWRRLVAPRDAPSMLHDCGHVRLCATQLSPSAMNPSARPGYPATAPQPRRLYMATQSLWKMYTMSVHEDQLSRTVQTDPSKLKCPDRGLSNSVGSRLPCNGLAEDMMLGGERRDGRQWTPERRRRWNRGKERGEVLCLPYKAGGFDEITL